MRRVFKNRHDEEELELKKKMPSAEMHQIVVENKNVCRMSYSKHSVYRTPECAVSFARVFDLCNCKTPNRHPFLQPPFSKIVYIL